MAVGVYCLNVGQGNCIAVIDKINTPNGQVRQATLIDVGVDGAKLVQWLGFIQVQRIRLVAATHNDYDHICGLEELVQGYSGRFGTLLFVPDRPEGDIPFWCDAQTWVDDGLIERVGQLMTDKEAKPGTGRVLLEPPDASYRLYCTYPTMFDTANAVRRAERAGGKLDQGPNATSAVIGLARPGSPNRIIVLFGGDLNFPGWRSLRNTRPKHRLKAEVFIVPHHGAPREPRKDFAHRELAEAVNPKYALVSAGTNQKHVKMGEEQTRRHPHKETVRALRDVGAKVLCTQITDRCLDDPAALPNGSVLPVLASPPPINLSPSGTACAGTVVVTIKSKGPVTVHRLDDHQLAVDGLLPNEHPICRP